jgi:hypothetical protein
MCPLGALPLGNCFKQITVFFGSYTISDIHPKKCLQDASWNHELLIRLYFALKYDAGFLFGPGGHHGDEGSSVPDPSSLEASRLLAVMNG